jgi:hypothetical protein
VVSGVEEWTVTGNVDNSTHLPTTGERVCFDQLEDPPGGFQLNPSISEGTFQEEFEDAVFGFTMEWWPFQTVVSEACAGDLIGAELLDGIREGREGSLWFALETAENGERIGQCVSVYQVPELTDAPGVIMMGVAPCEPLCAEVVLTNLSETRIVELQGADFILEGFVVPCLGLPASIEPGQEVRCVIEDYVTPGFQVLNWYGFPSLGNGWGFEYPFEEGE